MHLRFRDDKYGIVFHAGHETRFFSLAHTHTRVVYISLQQGNLRMCTFRNTNDIAFCHEFLG